MSLGLAVWGGWRWLGLWVGWVVGCGLVVGWLGSWVVVEEVVVEGVVDDGEQAEDPT